MSFVGNESISVTASTADDTVIIGGNCVLAGVTISTAPDVDLLFRDGVVGGDVLWTIPANSTGWQEAGDKRFPSGVYLDCNGAAAGVFEPCFKRYPNGVF